ncbi:hypothetical protein [Methanoculleus chikugoensis]|uniref:hypothetical protein n=1 Tax=Methanoculleus chikugoensis TaxID=118126 RepID=UPI001FB34882|nr:hypothetical protein [Methanoculleus chikugoensis]
MKGSEALARAIRQSADRCYAVPPATRYRRLPPWRGASNTVNEKTRSSTPSATPSPGGGRP